MIIEIIREYRVLKVGAKNKGIAVYSEERINDTIGKVCNRLINNYLKPRHGDIAVTIKYFIQGEKKMGALRFGPDKNERHSDYEPIETCHVFNFLKNHRKKWLHKIGRASCRERV